MNNQYLKKIELKIFGMHCRSCEILIEQKLKALAGVERINVNCGNGKAVIFCQRDISLDELNQALERTDYRVSFWGSENQDRSSNRNTKKDYLELGAVFLIVFAAYLLLKQFDFLPKSLGFKEDFSYGAVFLLGLVAAVSSCMAISGGLLLSISAKYNEKNPHLSGYSKFKPHLFFNLGRLASYTILGGAVGAVGSLFTFSSRATGILMIFASLMMIILGLDLLKLFPKLNRLKFKMPKFLAHKIYNAAGSEKRFAPFLLGGSTFFLPCGFTQAIQLYILSQGDAKKGAVTMLIFALGTLPGLLSLGLISSFVKNAFRRYFLKFTGVVVVMLGFFNINNGLALMGTNLNFSSLFFKEANLDQNVEIVDGKQMAKMKIVDLGYYPSRFTVSAGLPVEWIIDATEARGCARVIAIPQLDLVEYLPRERVKKITFTPKEPGRISFSCPMGMTTPGASFTVLPDTSGLAVGRENKIENFRGCDPEKATCLSAQQLKMEISRERGFYPNTFTVKKNLPVELQIETQLRLGGCMGTVVLPDYDIAKPLNIGKTILRFTPQESGTTYLTCSMGSPLAKINIID